MVGTRSQSGRGSLARGPDAAPMRLPCRVAFAIFATTLFITILDEVCRPPVDADRKRNCYKVKSAETVQSETNSETSIWLTIHRNLKKSADGVFVSLR